MCWAVARAANIKRLSVQTNGTQTIKILPGSGFRHVGLFKKQAQGRYKLRERIRTWVSSTRAPSLTPRPSASFKMPHKVGWFSPRSICPTCARSRLALCARSSWDTPSANRCSRKTRPDAAADFGSKLLDPNGLPFPKHAERPTGVKKQLTSRKQFEKTQSHPQRLAGH